MILDHLAKIDKFGIELQQKDINVVAWLNLVGV